MKSNAQETFPFIARPDESQKNAIVIDRTAKDDINFDSLSWVLRARSKDKTRPNLMGLYSDGMGKFAATDGHRLHIAEIPDLTEKIPAGIWLYVHETKEQISIREAPSDLPEFPDYEKIADITEDHVKRGQVINAIGDSGMVWDYFRLTAKECDIDYLLDIMHGIDSMDVFSTDGEGQGIFFCWENGDGLTKKALMMPFKGQRVS